MTATAVDPAVAPTEEWKHLFGICSRLGEDFGFDPLWLRIALSSALVLAPVQVIAAYFALGLVVLVSRLLFPERQHRPNLVASQPSARIAAHAEERALPLAA